MNRPSYIERIAKATDRFMVADLVRASATSGVAQLRCLSNEERVRMIEQYNRWADSLERSFSLDPEEGIDCPEKDHPWRDWLRKWGFLVNRECDECGEGLDMEGVDVEVTKRGVYCSEDCRQKYLRNPSEAAQ